MSKPLTTVYQWLLQLWYARSLVVFGASYVLMCLLFNHISMPVAGDNAAVMAVGVIRQLILCATFIVLTGTFILLATVGACCNGINYWPGLVKEALPQIFTASRAVIIWFFGFGLIGLLVALGIDFISEPANEAVAGEPSLQLTWLAYFIRGFFDNYTSLLGLMILARVYGVPNPTIHDVFRASAPFRVVVLWTLMMMPLALAHWPPLEYLESFIGFTLAVTAWSQQLGFWRYPGGEIENKGVAYRSS